MKLKAFFSFKSKPCSNIFSVFVIKRCFSLKRPRFRRRCFRGRPLRFRKPFSVRALRLGRCHPKRPKLNLRTPRRRRRPRLRLRRPRQPTPPNAAGDHRFGEKIAELVSVFRSNRRSKDALEDLTASSDVVVVGGGVEKEEFFSSPIAVVLAPADGVKEEVAAGNNEPALKEIEEEGGDRRRRSFESCVAEMVVEEGGMKDLVDVEEILYCWRNLKSPVFVELVCSFYGEISKQDVLVSSEEDDDREIAPASDVVA